MVTAARARQAVYWNTGFSMFRDVFQFALSVVLARLVAPESFGQATLVTGTIGFFIVFSFRSFLAHTLQAAADAEPDYQAHFTAGAVIQVGLFVLANLAAWVAGHQPVYREVQVYTHLASLVFLLDLPAELRVKQLERAMDWRRMRLLHVAGIIGSGALAVTLAALGAETFALVGPSMFVSIPFIIDLFIAERWRPDWSWSWERYRSAWRFGVLRLMSGVATAGRPLLESAVLARAAGFATLGLYGRASGLAQILCMKFVMVFLQAVYPLLTRRSAGTSTTSSNGLILRGATWIVVPLAVLSSAIAEPLVLTVYGERWLGAVPLVPYAMTVIALSALILTSYTLLLASNLASLCLWSDVFLFVAGAGSLAGALRFGIKSYLMAFAAAELVLMAVLWLVLVRAKLVGASQLAMAILPAAVSAVLASVIAAFAISGWLTAPQSAGWALAHAIVFGAAYLTVLRTMWPGRLAELVSRLPGERVMRAILLMKT